MKKLIIALIVLAALVGGYYLFSRGPSDVPADGKLDINAICDGALAYMTFPDGASAEAFLKACKAGERPEVIEQYKKDQGLGDGAAL